MVFAYLEAFILLPKLKLHFGFFNNSYFQTWSPLTLTGLNYYTRTVYCNSAGLRCSGCRITVWIVSSNSALLYRRSHSISHSNEIPLPQTLRMQYATLDRTVDIVCAVSICKGLVVGLCSSGVQNFDVSIDYRVCCVCSALLQS